MSSLLRFRSLLALGLVALLAALLPVGAADAGSKKHFSQVYTCAGSDDSDQLGSASDLTAIVNFGHWTGLSNPGHPCDGGKKFHPSATGVKVTFRWYAGSKLLRTSAGKFNVHPGGRNDDLHRNLTNSPGHCGWFLNGKKVTAKITLAKAGYATKVVTVSCFTGGE